MIRILCTGDSHCWGQGAKGALDEFDPPAAAGELRLGGFQPGGYVNRLRRLAEEKTGAVSFQWDARRLCAISGAPYAPPCARLEKAGLCLDFSGALLRMEYAADISPARAEVYVDDRLCFAESIPASTGSNDFRLLHIHLPDGPHRLSLRVPEGRFPLYRVESYAGPVAVVNAGVGSCSSLRYLREHLSSRAAPVRPDIVLAEAPAINDWLTGDPPGICADHLEALLRSFRDLGAKVVMMTASPIGGEQRWRSGPPYDEYIESSRIAAQRAGVPVCDANRILSACISGMDSAQAAEWLFDDPWHPNDRGHTIYAELLWQTLLRLGLPGR